MTESGAKKKWCPFVRIFNYQINGNNAFGNNMGESVNKKDGDIRVHCLASDCMAWREDLTREEAQSGYVAANGHCGLAGKP